MRYGFCTGFAAAMMGPICYPLLEEVARAGFDYVEFPLMQLADLPQGAFDTLARWLDDSPLAADATCNMFPARLKLTGPQVDYGPIEAYLEVAFARLARLGTRKIILGSSPARDLPAGTDEATGYRQMELLLRQYVLPHLEKHDCVLAIEPIAPPDANFITTLPQGMTLVERLNHPRVQLLADLLHLLSQGEDPADIALCRAALVHLHVSELSRALPTAGYSAGLQVLLNAVKAIDYDGTISFETVPCVEPNGIAVALRRLRLEF